MNEQQIERLLESLSELTSAHNLLSKAIESIANDGIAIMFLDDIKLSGKIETQLRTYDGPLSIFLINNSDCTDYYPLQIQIKE